MICICARRRRRMYGCNLCTYTCEHTCEDNMAMNKKLQIGYAFCGAWPKFHHVAMGHSHSGRRWWNLAMENTSFIDDFHMKTSIYEGCSYLTTRGYTYLYGEVDHVEPCPNQSIKQSVRKETKPPWWLVGFQVFVNSWMSGYPLVNSHSGLENHHVS